MNDFEAIYEQIIADPRYKANILYGKPRRGHAEGTVKAHIADLEVNLTEMVVQALVEFDSERYWKLKILIHVHDSFKMEAKRDSAILDPKSHASIAREYLAELTDDPDLLNITQWHDIGYAVFKKAEKQPEQPEHAFMSGPVTTLTQRMCLRCHALEASLDANEPCYDSHKLIRALSSIQDLDLFLLFAIIDACTPSKGRKAIRWVVNQVAKRYPHTTIRDEHVLSGGPVEEGVW